MAIAQGQDPQQIPPPLARSAARQAGDPARRLGQVDDRAQPPVTPVQIPSQGDEILFDLGRTPSGTGALVETVLRLRRGAIHERTPTGRARVCFAAKHRPARTGATSYTEFPQLRL